MYLKKKGKSSLRSVRAELRRLEGNDAAKRGVLPLGAEALDRHLPGGGLPLAGLHEIAGRRDEWDDGVAAGFCLALLARLSAVSRRPLLWIAGSDDLYGAGLLDFGLDPAALLRVRVKDDRGVLWALEQALRCAPLAAVVGEVACLDRTAGRRLQLAAESAGVTAFVLRRRRVAAGRGEPASAALTRWRVAPAPSGPAVPASLPGRPRWRLDLCRCRGAAPAQFIVEWDDAADCFALVAEVCDGSVDSPAQAAGRI